MKRQRKADLPDDGRDYKGAIPLGTLKTADCNAAHANRSNRVAMPASIAVTEGQQHVFAATYGFLAGLNQTLRR